MSEANSMSSTPSCVQTIVFCLCVIGILVFSAKGRSLSTRFDRMLLNLKELVVGGLGLIST